MKKLVILLLVLGILVGCSNNTPKESNKEVKTFTYIGEKENWKATLIAKKTDQSDQYNYTMNIEYKNNTDDLKAVNKINYSFKIGLTEISRSEKRDDGLPTGKSIVYKDTGDISFDFNELTTLPFSIEWNDKVEEFELNINKN